MAVIQISRIQVRRGLQENLPQLAAGELGWSVDTQRLFIGNGTLEEGAPELGNTEIITAGQDVLAAIQSYTFQGAESGYISQTGVNSFSDVKRSLQNKFDEQISARDFGAKGDGITDDSAALQRAIDQVYPKGAYYNTVSVRRTLKIPAGVYNLGSRALTIPPHAYIIGDGPESTVLKHTSSSNVVVALRDSLGQIGGSLGNSGAELPYNIKLADLTLQTTTDDHIAVIDSANNVTFDRVKFLGSLLTPTTTGNNKAAAQLQDSAGNVSQVTFNQCQFKNTTYGITATGAISSVLINDSKFNTLYQGFVSADGATFSPESIKITSSEFDNINQEAIYSIGASSTISAFNFFKGVGYGNVTLMNSGTPTSPVLYWESRNNYGFFDNFARPTSDIIIQPLLESNDNSSAIKFQSAFAIGSAVTFPGDTDTLADNTSSAANTSLYITSVTSTVIVDYAIIRGTAYRSGVIKASQYNGSIIYDDEYSETANTGVILGFLGDVSNNLAVLTYTTTSTGSDATFKYSLRTFV